MYEKANRELIFKLFSKGLGPMAIAKRLEGVVSQSTVYKIVKDYKDTGKTERKPSTWKVSIRTIPLRKRVREKIRQDPRRSMRRMARDEGVLKTIMWRLCREDLGMIPYKKQRRQDGTPPPILWTDEKLFTMEAVHNIHNDRVLGTSKDSLGINVLSHF